MEKFKNIILIGTSHIAKQSIDEVTTIINEVKPDIIALELDKRRYFTLLQKKKPKISILDIKNIGIKGYLFMLIGAWVEKKLGDYVGVPPGSEMKHAIKLAKKHKLMIALIDQDIEVTLKKLSHSLTWKEKWNFFVDILKAIITRKKEVEFDLTKVPPEKLIEEMMKKVKLRYPNFYKTLVEERNIIMANNIKYIMGQHTGKLILVIIGAGHLKEILSLVQK